MENFIVLCSVAIGEVCKETHCNPFSFFEVDKEEVLKEILNLDTSKTCQNTDVPIKILKEKTSIFADFVTFTFLYIC